MNNHTHCAAHLFRFVNGRCPAPGCTGQPGQSTATVDANNQRRALYNFQRSGGKGPTLNADGVQLSGGTHRGKPVADPEDPYG